MGQRRQVNNHVRSQVIFPKCSNKHLIIVLWRNGCSNWKKIKNYTKLRPILEEMGQSNSQFQNNSYKSVPSLWPLFLPQTHWSSSFAVGRAMLLGKHHPASRLLQIQAMVSYLATKKSGVEFSSPVSLQKTACFHVFIWAFWMQKSRQSSAGSMLWSPGCSHRGGCVGGCILPWLLWVAGAVKMQLSLESWMRGTCPHIHAAVSVCPDGRAASPSLSSGAFLCSDHTSWWHCRHTFRNPRQFPP